MTNKLIEAMTRAMYSEAYREPGSALTAKGAMIVAQAALKAISDAGYAVAPREPTEAMTAMGGNVLDCADSIDAAVIYRAMINAATTEEINDHE